VWILTFFFRTHIITYFIKKVAITDRQARERLAQAQRKKKKGNKHDNSITQSSNLAQTQESVPRGLNQLLAASNATNKSLHILVAGGSKESA
jgi:hypothetical protein